MTNDVPHLDDAEIRRRRRWRSIAIGLTLAGLVVLFYLLTIVKMAAGGGFAGGA